MKSLIKTALTFSIVFLFIGSVIIPTIYGSNVKGNLFKNFGFFELKQASITRGLEEQDINETMKELLDLGHIPGISACIIKNNSVVWSDGFGYRDIRHKLDATDDTVHPIASVTKLFTATAIMQLYEEGKFDLDDNVSDYLGFDLKNPKYPKVNITFRMLLAHQSSLADINIRYLINFMLIGYPKSWLEEYLLVDGLFYSKKAWKSYAPGENVFYSNINIELLGLLVEIFSGQPYEEYVKDNILDPLEMYNTSFYLEDFDPYMLSNQYFWYGFYVTLPHFIYGIHAAGGLCSTVLDLSHFLIAYMQNGTYKGYQLLEPDIIKEMFTIQYPDSFDGKFRFGLGWYFWNASDNKSYGGHGGIAIGGRSELRWRLDDDVGVIFCWNRDATLNHYIHHPLLFKNYKNAYKQFAPVLYNYTGQLN